MWLKFLQRETESDICVFILKTGFSEATAFDEAVLEYFAAEMFPKASGLVTLDDKTAVVLTR